MAVALFLLAVRADLRSHLQQHLEVVLGQRSGVEVGRSEQMLVRIRDDFEDTFGCGFLPLFRCRGGERLGVAALFFLILAFGSVGIALRRLCGFGFALVLDGTLFFVIFLLLALRLF